MGDSNVRRNLNQLSRGDRPAISTCELLVCGHLDAFETTLRSIRVDSDSCIISCLTNFLASASLDGPFSSVLLRVDPVLDEVKEILLSFCQEQPERSWFLAPPMYRTSPVWYLGGLPEILVRFSEVFSIEKPPNLYLLPSFSFPEFESDGIHLLPYPGLKFVISLFDGAKEALESARRFDLA